MARALLLYGTGEGHTTDVATEIARTLTEHGLEVDTRQIGEGVPPSTSGYDGVVIGSSIHMGRHDRHVIDWVRHRRAELAGTPAAFFTVCLSAAGEKGDPQLASSYVDGFLEETGWHPDIVGLFGGALLYTQYGYAKRMVIKGIAARQGLPTDTSRDWDFTDYEAVRHFAADAAHLIAAGTPSPDPAGGRPAADPEP